MPSIVSDIGSLQKHTEERAEIGNYMYDSGGISNADVIEKINAILGNTLDLSNLTGSNLATETNKATMTGIPSSLEHLLSELSTSVDVANMNTSSASNTSEAYPGLHPFSVGNSTGNSSSSSSSSYSSKSANLDYGTHSQRDFTHPTDSYNQGDYARNLMEYARSQTKNEYTKNQLSEYSRQQQQQQEYNRSQLEYLQQHNSHLECNRSQLDYMNQMEPHSRGSNQASRDYMGRQDHASYTQSDFIQGAISNRTLEQLTEAACTRPYRAIRAEHKVPNTMEQIKSPLGAVGDLVFTSSPIQSPTDGSTASAYQQHLAQSSNTTPPNADSNLTRLFNHSPSPSDSDTSGIGSECSETALIDLMNSLSLGQSPLVGGGQPAIPSIFHNQLPNPLPGNLLGGMNTQMELLRALGLQQDFPGLLHRSDQQTFNLTGMDLNSDKNRLATTSAINPFLTSAMPDPYAIEKQAKLYRNAASVCEANCTWSGQLPTKVYRNPTYSCKVFLGGVPWDITEVGLQTAFKSFGPMKIEWPGRDGKHPRYPTRGEYRAGYVYVLFESEKSVKALLASCTHDFSNGGEYYFKISSRRMRSKEVQVIPWVLSDSNSVRQPSQRLDPSKTVFVGALHGMLMAEGLAHILNDLFGNVVYAGIDTDKHKYPIGSGRVTFSSTKSYMKAVNAAFVEIKTPKFTKKVQIDPYLEDSLCNICSLQQGPFFCRDLTCFRYYCRSCWQWTHAFESTRHHKPLMRNSRTSPNALNTNPVI